MALSDSFLQELKMKTDIEDVISTYVTLKRRGATLVGLCPFHNEKTPSFTVYPATQSFYCFGCGAGGDAITFLKKIENLDYLDAVKTLAQRAGLQMPQEGFDDSLSKRRRRILEMNREAARFYHSVLLSPEGKVGYDYYIGRALSAATINHFGLGFAPNQWDALLKHMRAKGYQPAELVDAGLARKGQKGYYDNFRNRVMTPIIDVRGNVIAFGGRVLDDSKPKYINTGDTLVYKKTNELFALNFAKDSKEDALILCEGYMDVIALHQAGFTNAVASLGTAFTEQQANLIRRYTDEVLLTYDSDGAGIKAAMRAIPMLRRAGITGKVIHMEPYKDPDEFIKNLGAEEFEKRMEEAQNSFFFEIEVIKKNYSMSDPEQKTKFVHETARKLLVFEDKIQRDNYLEAVAARYNIKTEDLRQLVVRYGNQMPSGYQEVMEERQQERIRKGKKKETREGISYSYRLLLSWLIEEPKLFVQIREWVKPEDFEEGLYRTVAKELYDQLDRGDLEPARIIGHFEEVEDQNKVASMFQTSFGSKIENDEKKKAITDLILKIKEHSIERQAGQITDLNELQKLVQQKKMLQGAVNLHIS